ncbi:flagellar assembly peptidoglycan hydrolase FlgJ [Salinicola halophilus]|uniref:flagellar assembly peptidoglycan hydrolase FlgJ n=1 Tax=Salinicola halophilus TaxID=184065 RepID=UPI000DA1FAC0|nr:flagellar assembly peptidoglycan hydrolase FlgJ [Salinicola halophilus]
MAIGGGASSMDLSSQFALDVKGIQKLKVGASHSTEGSLKEAARQFEAIFLQTMLKSMRDASPQSGLLQSQQRDMMTSMQDQQWAQHLAGKGFGLAEQLVAQLEGSGLPGTQAAPPADGGKDDIAELIAGIPRGEPRLLQDGLRVQRHDASESLLNRLVTEGATRDAASMTSDATAEPSETAPSEASFGATIAALAGDAARFAGRAAHVADFLTQLAGPAKKAEAASGVPAELILAQAALETGWGRREIPTADGGNSHNLFGIKAGSHWRGATTDVGTTEYVSGRPVKMVDSFRVYDSYADAFTDYAKLIGDNPRYRDVVEARTPQGAAEAIQRAGYATDPRYAEKLGQIMRQFGSLDGAGETLAMAGNAPPANPHAATNAPTTIF